MNRTLRILLLSGGLLILLIISALLIVLPADRIPTPANFPTLTGPYLGQNPPGKVPVPFAPKIIGEDIHATVVFSPDGSEVYWRPFSDQSDEIFYMGIENGSWTQPRVVPFASRISDSDDPFLSADGNRLYFTSWRPLNFWKIFNHKERIWFVERTTRGWSRPSPISDAVNDMDLHWQFSISEKGTLYFTSGEDLYKSSSQAGNHLQPVKLGSPINTPAREGHPWIASDESFLIFSSNYGTANPNDYNLYLSRKSNQDKWETPLNLGPKINTSAQELYPVLSPDQNYLFFLRSRESGLCVYWVDFQSVLAELDS